MRQIVARCALVPAFLLTLVGCGTRAGAPTPLPLPTLAVLSGTMTLPACPTGDVFALDGQHLSENGADFILHVTGDQTRFSVTGDRTSPSAGFVGGCRPQGAGHVLPPLARAAHPVADRRPVMHTPAPAPAARSLRAPRRAVPGAALVLALALVGVVASRRASSSSIRL